MSKRETNELTNEHFGQERPEEEDSFMLGEDEKTQLQNDKLQHEQEQEQAEMKKAQDAQQEGNENLRQGNDDPDRI